MYCKKILKKRFKYRNLVFQLLSFSHLGFWSENFFLIAPFPGHYLFVPFYSNRKAISLSVTSLQVAYTFFRCSDSIYDNTTRERVAVRCARFTCLTGG